MRVMSRKPAGREAQQGRVLLAPTGGDVHEGGRRQLGHVAHHRDQRVVMAGAHGDDLGAERHREVPHQPRTRVGIGRGGRASAPRWRPRTCRRRRRRARPAPTRPWGDRRRSGRRARAGRTPPLDHDRLHRADVGDDRRRRRRTRPPRPRPRRRRAPRPPRGRPRRPQRPGRRRARRSHRTASAWAPRCRSRSYPVTWSPRARAASPTEPPTRPVPRTAMRFTGSRAFTRGGRRAACAPPPGTRAGPRPGAAGCSSGSSTRTQRGSPPSTVASWAPSRGTSANPRARTAPAG